MIICVPRQAYNPDMLVAGKIPLPESFQFAIGNGIDLEMHGGRLRGRLTITGKDPDPRWFRCLWTCPGSQYDGREFVVSPRHVF